MGGPTPSEVVTPDIGWVVIPPTILCADDLSMGEKVLWGRINGLSGKLGYCYASNAWLGSQLGYTERTVEGYVCALVRKGYLRREYGPKGKRDRRLFPIPQMIGMRGAEASHPANSRDEIPQIAGKPSLPEPGCLYVSSTAVSDRDESTNTMSARADAPHKPTIFCDGTTYSAAFEEAWAVWRTLGRTDNKQGAGKAWNTTLRTKMNGNAPEASAAILLQAARNFGEAMRLEARPADKILHASTFFGGNERWRDYEHWTPGGAAVKAGTDWNTAHGFFPISEEDAAAFEAKVRRPKDVTA